MLAENDRIDELRQQAEAGDDHAQRQLASWLSDRRQIDEAITVIRPLADADDDIAQLWLARWLSERDDADELRRRAGTGDSHALHHLAGWLAGQGGLDELRELLTDHRELLASSWGSTYGQHQMEVLRLGRISETMAPGKSWSAGWPGCGSGLKRVMSMPSERWPNGRTSKASFYLGPHVLRYGTPSLTLKRQKSLHMREAVQRLSD